MDPSSLMAGSLNPLDDSARIHDLEYLYASNANVSNFVSVKLSSDRNYHLWKTQMLCLMKSHNMAGIVDEKYKRPRASGKEIMEQYDSLLKGWIFGSASENVLGAVVDLDSAKHVWDQLKSFFDASVSNQKGETKAEAKAEAETNKEQKAQTNTYGGDTLGIFVDTTKTETEGGAPDDKAAGKDKTEKKKILREATMKGDWMRAESILKEDNDLVREAINSDGSTILHIAVGIGNNYFVKNLFSYISAQDVAATRKDESTALHIAAIVGNKYAADLLLKKNKDCLTIKDKMGKEPLHKAYENMHLDTIRYLLNVIDAVGERVSGSSSTGGLVQPDLHSGDEMGVNLLVNTISAKQYKFACVLIKRFPEFASKNDDVLLAIARTFPSGDYGETYKSQSWKHLCGSICSVAKGSMSLLILRGLLTGKGNETSSLTVKILSKVIVMVPALLAELFLISFAFIQISSALLLYVLNWIRRLLVEPITHNEKKKKEMDEAEKVLELVCDEIDKLESTGTHHPYYTRPILEAACQNAHKVVDEILYRSPEAILSRDKSGHDIIQLAVIQRSQRIYNLIYDSGERKNLYRTMLDSSKNNILHLAGRLAPSRKLNKRRGAALQLQREIQWQKTDTTSVLQESLIFYKSPT